MLGMTNAIINNLLNNIFHVVWLYMLAIEPKYTKGKRIIFCIAAAVIAEALSLFTMIVYGVESTAFTLLYIVGSAVFAYLYIFLLQGGKKLKACFIFFSYICVWAAVYVAAMVIYNNFFYGVEPAIWIIRTLFNVVLLLLYYYIFQEKVLKKAIAIEKSSAILLVVSGMAYLILPVLMLIYAFSEQTAWSLAVTLFLLVFILAVYLLVFRFIKQLGKEAELQKIEAQNKLLTEAIQYSEKKEQLARQSRHDHRHHNQLIIEYAKNGDTDAILRYLEEYEQRETENMPKRYSHNGMVNNILRSYIKKAEDKGIAVIVDVRMNEKTAVSDVDMVAILGNMLENAINGADVSEGEKKIWISVYHKGFKLILVCKNTCKENILFADGLPVRENGKGVGASSIVMAAKRYSGDTIFSAENGVFSCAVLLNEE